MSESASPGFLRRHGRTLVASLALAFGFGWVLNSGALPLLPPAGTLAGLAPWPFTAFVVLLVIHMVVRAGRTWFLLAPIAKVPLGRLLIINGIAGALITFLPFRIGELSRPAMLREKGKLSAGAVTGTVGAERILDGILFSLMLLFGLVIAEPHLPLPEQVGGLPISAALVPRAAQIASIGFACAFAAMVVFYRWRVFARRATERIVGIVSAKLGRKLADLLERLSEGLRFLADVRHALPYTLVTFVSIFIHVLSMELLAEAVGIPELTLAQTSVVVGVLALGFAMPNAPGFFGAVQLALYAGLATYIAPAKVVHEGAAMVFLFYVTYLAIIVIGAVLALAIEYGRSGQAERRARAEVTSSS